MAFSRLTTPGFHNIDVVPQRPASKNCPAATQSRRTHSRNVEVDPLRSVLGGEPGIEPADDENGAESGLPVRHSRRLASTKRR